MGLKNGREIKKWLRLKYPGVFTNVAPTNVSTCFCDYSGVVHPLLAYKVRRYRDISIVANGFLDGFRGRYECKQMYMLMETPGAVPLAKNPTQRKREKDGFAPDRAEEILMNFCASLPQAVEPDETACENERKKWYRQCLDTRAIKTHIFNEFTNSVFNSYSTFDCVTVFGREKDVAFKRVRDGAWKRVESAELPPEGEGKIVPAMLLYGERGTRVVATGRDGDILASLLLAMPDLDAAGLDVWWDTDMDFTYVHISELWRLMRAKYGDRWAFLPAYWLVQGCDTIYRPDGVGDKAFKGAFSHKTLAEYFEVRDRKVVPRTAALREKLYGLYKAWSKEQVDACTAQIGWTMGYMQSRTLAEIPNCVETVDGVSRFGWVQNEKGEGIRAEKVIETC